MHHWRYLKELLAHKWHVFRFCWRLAPMFPPKSPWGLVWRGITHDLSRFLPDEWGVHARFFCGNLSAEERERLRSELDAAYARHIRRNDHHWQHIKVDGYWWCEGGVKPPDWRAEHMHRMHWGAVAEMLADWQARALYRDRKPLREWLREQKDLALHPETERVVAELLPIVETFR